MTQPAEIPGLFEPDVIVLSAEIHEGALEAMATLHTRIRAIGDLLKTEVVTVLDLELPDRAQGDND